MDLTKEAFDAFLGQLGPDRSHAGEKYLELRRRLVRFFEWRGCPSPQDHTDEVLNRVARRVFEGEQMRDATGYLLGTARLLALEIHKQSIKEERALEAITYESRSTDEPDGIDPRVRCLEQCLDGLVSVDRELILGYYQGDKARKIQNRKDLTGRLNISIPTLRMRALRIREGLRSCVQSCVQG